ncbi:BgTH12-02624 [Blumeria graminis f. sp. triticale]|uniref:Bgt-51919 n=2 Tax=Blumeria graminis TaxID=34373 RepID=A0A9X9MIK8_BLUGR|nr:BgTH12-02624 [Blumeria graminis f. sp. triticale]VDB88825.1 Bgt-51919 [Blumeria graminis f. sp. tritici]
MTLNTSNHKNGFFRPAINAVTLKAMTLRNL